MSEWVSQIVESALKGTVLREMINTEEVLALIDTLNEKWEEEGFNPEDDEIFVGSLDAEALYPSLDTDRVADICGQLVMDSGLIIDNVNWMWASCYVASNMKQNEVN